ncbi:MAG: helix-turn-helix transcriptional regulator [Ruminococcaceae bacterium]|nr:helix-turn-helix transcriptional regulator [Oscillospiraceae bacterium]
MEYMEWFSTRLTELRLEKGVSARDMSLSLGQSESYINKIENRRTMPSMAGFFYICEYLGIEPADFFNSESRSPKKALEILNEFEKLSPVQAEHILSVIKDLVAK